MRQSRGLVAIAILAALFAAALGPSTAAACCRSAAPAVEAACGGCCPQASVCAPRPADDSTTARTFAYAAPAAARLDASVRPAGFVAACPSSSRPDSPATPPHLSHIPLLV